MSERNGLFVDYCAKDFLDGTQLLGPWEELAYRRIVDMIYATNDNLPDDDRKLAWMTKVGTRWKAAKAALLATGKIVIQDGRITNARCQKALAKSAKKIAQASGAGKASAATGKSLKNLERHGTNVPSAVATDAGTTQGPKDPRVEKEEPIGSSKKRGTRLPIDFDMPVQWFDDGAAAREKAHYPKTDLRTEAVKFTNHFGGASGQRGVKLDWHATWINWCLNAKGFEHGRSNGTSRRGPATGYFEGAALALADRAAALAQRPPDRGEDFDLAGPLLDG